MPYDVYEIPDVPWSKLMRKLARTEDVIARLDERLAKSPIRDGWIARTHFLDACASLWLEGELVHVEDLVLHDVGMDVRTPTHELVRSRAVLLSRRRIQSLKIDWPPSRHELISMIAGRREVSRAEDEDSEVDDFRHLTFEREGLDELDAAIEAVDAVVTRSEFALRAAGTRAFPVYDEDWDEASRLSEWFRIISELDALPPTLAAVIAQDSWSRIEPLQNASAIQRLIASSLLRFSGKTVTHLTLLNLGLKNIPRERRQHRDPLDRYDAGLDALAAAATRGLQDHETWLAARMLLERKLKGRRSSSQLHKLVDLIVARPVVSTSVISAELGVTSRAALDMVAELGVRELTGRGRFRAWGIV